ncbi:MAG TPA: hypothetical protein VN920_13060 [Pyrinomonadaceae bacterium]|nr:hypothetical protein [Pyrinomonadaceae bacterium]
MALVLAGYLLGLFIYLLSRIEDPVAGLRGDWRLIRMDYPYIVGSWDSQYLFALIVLCCSIFYLARAILRRNAFHRAADNNPLEQHMMEKGDPQKSLTKQSAGEATGVWLRLRNMSPLPISFSTDSFYLPRPNCGVQLSNGKSGPALCDGREVSIQYQIEDANGKRIPWGIDVSSTSILPPGASVLGVAPVNNWDNRINRQGEIIWSHPPISQEINSAARICEPKIKPPDPPPEEIATRRRQIHKLMLKGEYEHDGAGELLYIGDITSVPALLRVLKDNPPTVLADGSKSYICTYAHASAALRKITGYNAGSYEEWVAWWEEYRKSHPK